MCMCIVFVRDISVPRMMATFESFFLLLLTYVSRLATSEADLERRRERNWEEIDRANKFLEIASKRTNFNKVVYGDNFVPFIIYTWYIV